MSDQNPESGNPTPPQQPQEPPQPPQGGDKGKAEEQHVPYARFKQINDELKALKEQQQAKVAAEKTLEERLAALEQERNQQAAENMRLKVASRKKLPEDLADRLRGSSVEELEQDADRLLAFLKPASGPGVPPPGGGNGKPSAFDYTGKSPAEIRKAMDEGKF